MPIVGAKSYNHPINARFASEPSILVGAAGPTRQWPAQFVEQVRILYGPKKSSSSIEDGDGNGTSTSPEAVPVGKVLHENSTITFPPSLLNFREQMYGMNFLELNCRLGNAKLVKQLINVYGLNATDNSGCIVQAVVAGML